MVPSPSGLIYMREMSVLCGLRVKAESGSALRPKPLCWVPWHINQPPLQALRGGFQRRGAPALSWSWRGPAWRRRAHQPRHSRGGSAVRAAARRGLGAASHAPARQSFLYSSASSSLAGSDPGAGWALPPRSRLTTLRFDACFQSHPFGPRAVPSQQVQSLLRGQPPREQAHASDMFAVTDEDTDARLCGAHAGSSRPRPLC